jgi:peptidyl-dipeptidase A
MLVSRLLLPAGFALALLLFFHPLATLASDEVTGRARKFLDAHTAKLRPLEIAAARAWWDANISGKDEDFKKKADAQNRVDAALADADAFKEVKNLRDQKKDIDDKVLARAIDVLYLSYLEKQLDTDLLKKMVEKGNKVEQVFNVFRANVDGQEWTDGKVRATLKSSKDSTQRKNVWEASKVVGAKVEADLKELVKLRNQAAKKLGFSNYHSLQLYLNEQNGDELIKLFDELDDLTREPFKAAKAEIDARLAKMYGIKTTELMPWHYQDPFFQEAPAVFDVDLDAPYAQADIPKLTGDFYRGIGLPIDDVLDRSDLKPRDGKVPHAFCTDIDRAGDVRVLANIVPNLYWMSTTLHECGHSVYSSKNIPESVPYVLRWESHILTTEGVAMMFERLAYRGVWAEKMQVELDDPKAFDKAGAQALRYRLLIFSRWCQVMLRFEKGMYEKPEQDLNKLWWDMVEKYQMVQRPPDRSLPDYASKIHIVSAPVYYHNYMMGELFASQVHHAIAKEVFKGADPNSVVYIGNKDVGAFMNKRVFEPGRTLSWNELTEHATGAKLNPKAFAADFQEKK